MKSSQVIRVDNPPESSSLARVMMRMDALREITSRYASMRASIIGNAIPNVIVHYDSNHRVENVTYLYSDAIEEALRYLEEEEKMLIDDLDRKYNIKLTDF